MKEYRNHKNGIKPKNMQDPIRIKIPKIDLKSPPGSPAGERVSDHS